MLTSLAIGQDGAVLPMEQAIEHGLHTALVQFLLCVGRLSRVLVAKHVVKASVALIVDHHLRQAS